uniref:Actin binding LIM protein 1b n=1 Tax=Sphaeramia orbicularis TaxID=375764 RepID=A0A673BWH6_9TELE
MDDQRLCSECGNTIIFYNIDSPVKPMEVIQCLRCGESCKGEVLRVQSSHFHIKCFTCKVCGCDLAQSGFFMKNGDYLCPLDFQRLHGTLCNNCGEFVEGEVVTVLGKSYHPACFVCTICNDVFSQCLQLLLTPAIPTVGVCLQKLAFYNNKQTKKETNPIQSNPTPSHPIPSHPILFM